MKQILRSAATTAVVALTSALLAAPVGVAVPTQRLEPRDLPRGADVLIPHVEDDRVFVDGARRVEIDADRVDLLGASGDAFLLSTTDDEGTSLRRVVRLEPDGTTTVLLRGAAAYLVRLTADGSRLVQARVGMHRPWRTTISSWSARTGALRARHVIDGYADLVDADRRRAVLSSGSRTFWFHLRSGRRTPIVARGASAGDIETDRLSTYTGDPYLGGCTVVSRLSRPRVALWRSCKERVHNFSPDGASMMTIDLLADGIGPSRVWVRRVRGDLVGRYVTDWFGAIEWEDDDTVLLDVNGRHNSATVRCTAQACETASDLGPRVELRPAR